MITNIPTHIDFITAGVDYLNLAWDNLLQLSEDISYAEEYDVGCEDDNYSKFWESAQKILLQSLSLVQQSNEFFIKGMIASISPFLLISGEPRNWPKGCDSSDVQFSSFKTIDATDLPRVYNTVCAPRLTEEFMYDFEFLRRARNTIMHTVDKSLITDVKSVYLSILKSYYYFNNTKSWIMSRTEYLNEREPRIHLFPYINVKVQVYIETTEAIKSLSRTEINKYYGISKARRYICPKCQCSDFGNADLKPDLVQLTPNKPTSKIAKCFLCEESFAVERNQCNNCKSNVIYKNDNSCLLCEEPQS